MALVQLFQLDYVACNKMLFCTSCKNHCAVCCLGLITPACYFSHPWGHLFSHWMMMVVVEVKLIEEMPILRIRSVRFVFFQHFSHSLSSWSWLMACLVAGHMRSQKWEKTDLAALARDTLEATHKSKVFRCSAHSRWEFQGKGEVSRRVPHWMRVPWYSRSKKERCP